MNRLPPPKANCETLTPVLPRTRFGMDFVKSLASASIRSSLSDPAAVTAAMPAVVRSKNSLRLTGDFMGAFLSGLDCKGSESIVLDAKGMRISEQVKV